MGTFGHPLSHPREAQKPQLCRDPRGPPSLPPSLHHSTRTVYAGGANCAVKGVDSVELRCKGECLPRARARRATFLLTIPTSAPDLPSHGEAPQVDHVALHTFPTKHVA